MNALLRLVRDERGFVVSSELVLVSSIAVVGMIVGLTTMRDQVVQELGDAAIAISQVNQSYYWSPIVGHHSSTAGSIFNDTSDDCDVFADPVYVAPACIVLDPVVPWPPHGVVLEGI